MTDNNQLNPDGYSSNTPARKATDVLLAIENKVDMLQKLVFNQDMLLKLVADRTNKIFSYIEELKQEYVQSQNQGTSESEEDPRIINVSDEHAISESKLPNVSSVRAARTSPSSGALSQPISAITNQTPKDTSPQEQEDFGSDKKVPTIQRVSDHTGKDLFMATVVISDENGKEVHKTKTNAMGKWQAILKPGKYMVKITKTDNATKKLLESNQNIIVKNSNSPITLPVVIINR